MGLDTDSNVALKNCNYAYFSKAVQSLSWKRANWFPQLLRLAFTSAFVLLLGSNLAIAQCINDVDILAATDLDERRACTEIGEIQLEYLEDNLYFSVNNFDEKYGDYINSRAAFYLLRGELMLAKKHEGYTPNFREILDLFQVSMFSSSLMGNIEGKRGALYFMAFMEIANKYGGESNLGSPEIFEFFSEIGHFGFPFDDQFLKPLSLCFWEFDIPTLPVDVVLESKAVAKCMAADGF